jgi:glycosyltransferase involved in cell wall biosynthesis
MENAVIQLHQSEGFQHIKKYFIFGVPFLIAEKIYPKFFKRAITINEIGKIRFGLRKNVGIISNGFDPMLIEQKALEKDYILFLGRLHINQKGLDTLLASLKFTNARLLIAGSGKDHSKVLKMFKNYINSGIVELIGFVSGKNKVELLCNCNFLVMPSRYEGQPIALIEAAACQKPVVVSKISELKFAVDEGFGVSFETNNPKELGEKINYLLKNEKVRKEMGQKAREYARNYTWDNIADKYEKFLIEMKEAS